MLNRGSIYTLLCFIIMYSYVKRRLKQIYQNLIEDRYKEKAATTKKANIYFNHLVRASRTRKNNVYISKFCCIKGFFTLKSTVCMFV